MKMKESRVKFGGISIAVPADWQNVTADLQDSDAPFTLAKSDGKGALQFSTALYQCGPHPNMTIDELGELLRDFAQQRNLGTVSQIEIVKKGPLKIVAANFMVENNLLRVWYSSDGNNLVLATYVCLLEDVSDELADCEKVINSILFS